MYRGLSVGAGAGRRVGNFPARECIAIQTCKVRTARSQTNRPTCCYVNISSYKFKDNYLCYIDFLMRQLLIDLKFENTFLKCKTNFNFGGYFYKWVFSEGQKLGCVKKKVNLKTYRCTLWINLSLAGMNICCTIYKALKKASMLFLLFSARLYSTCTYLMCQQMTANAILDRISEAAFKIFLYHSFILCY